MENGARWHWVFQSKMATEQSRLQRGGGGCGSLLMRTRDQLGIAHARCDPVSEAIMRTALSWDMRESFHCASILRSKELTRGQNTKSHNAWSLISDDHWWDQTRSSSYQPLDTSTYYMQSWYFPYLSLFTSHSEGFRTQWKVEDSQVEL